MKTNSQTLNFLTLNMIACLTMAFCGGVVVGQSENKSEAKAQPAKAQKFDVADGQLMFAAPGDWKKITPKFDFYHAEFNIPKADGDPKEGRITFSQVGGSIKQNLDRWVGQFKGVDAGNEEQVKNETQKIAGKEVKTIMIKGTFMDGAGPMAPKTDREDYVLLGAAIEMDQGANVYIKAYGPKKTMEANQKAFKKMLMEMKVGEKVD